MHEIEQYILDNTWCAWICLAVSFFILAKCADLFVEAAVAIAGRLSVPKLVVGIVLVSFATTTPELTVSFLAALKGNPEMALGNAIGSVICDDGLALGFAGFIAVTPIAVSPGLLKTAGVFLLAIEALAFFFVFQDYTLSRPEGGILIVLFAGYTYYLYYQHKSGKLEQDLDEEIPEELMQKSGVLLFLLFVLALVGIIGSSEFVVTSAKSIALSWDIPESVIALTLVAFGTSVPEVATCIAAARKGHGEIAIGNILGADIMNICWVAGASALANDLTLGAKEVWFMFPSMFIIVGAMLLMLRHNHRLTRLKGKMLLGLYVVYLVALFIRFPPQHKQPDQPKAQPAIEVQTP